MNKVILMGRLTRDPDIRSSQSENAVTVARFTIAVDRRYRRDADQSADFISCVAFGRTADFFEKYVKQGTKVCVEGRIQTGSYTNRDGQKVYTTDVVVENVEFAESKNTQTGAPAVQPQSAPAQDQYRTPQPQPQSAPADFMNAPSAEAAIEGFMSIPDGLEDEGLPFN